MLEAVDERTCAIAIQTVESKDEGIWNFTIESGSGKYKKIVKYSHNVSVTVGWYTAYF